MITYGSLFTGIGGFDLGFDRAGMRCAWQVEIDRACHTVLDRRYPGVPRHFDVRDCGAHNLAPVDVISFGSPCQDLSVAGKRAGLGGERSRLFHEAIRIVGELRPAFAVWENVPGALSSNDGQDIITALDAFEDLGYIVDCDIIDAQYFGVAQRRRRVFAVCQRADHLRRQMTTTSSLTIAQCVSEMLQSILAEARCQSLIGYESSVSSRRFSADGLRRRMRLFGLPTENGPWSMLLGSWAGVSPRSSADTARSDWAHGGASAAASSTAAATPSCRERGERLATAASSRCLSIGSSWNAILDDLCDAANQCITSTASRPITESRIFTFAQALLIIGERICQSSGSFPAFWSAASSVLIALREYTNYARRASSSLFGAMEWVLPWADFADRAARVCQSLGRIGVVRYGEVLALADGSPRHPAPRREAGQGVARPLAAGSRASSGYRLDADTAENLVPVAVGDKAAGFAEGETGWGEPQIGLPVYPTLMAQQVSDVSHFQHGVVQPIAIKGAAIGRAPTAVPQWGETLDDGTCYTLNCAETHAVAHAAAAVSINQRRENDLRAAHGSLNGQPSGTQFDGVLEGMIVRRLTPVECSRLQGFPDDWLNGLPDSARYRMLGNAVAVPVAAWLGRNIAAALAEKGGAA